MLQSERGMHTCCSDCRWSGGVWSEPFDFSTNLSLHAALTESSTDADRLGLYALAVRAACGWTCQTQTTHKRFSHYYHISIFTITIIIIITTNCTYSDQQNCQIWWTGEHAHLLSSCHRNRRYQESLGFWARPGNWKTGHINHWRTQRIHFSVSAVVSSPPKGKWVRLPQHFGLRLDAVAIIPCLVQF